MKSFLIFLVILVALMLWFRDWVSTGKMDAFIRQHESEGVTPVLLLGWGEACKTAKSPEAASRYYRWLVDKYPEKKFIPKVRFHLAESYEELKDKKAAMEQYAVLKDSFSLTDYGRMAQKKWEMIKF